MAVPPNAAQLDPAGLPGRGASCWGGHPGQNPVPTLAWPGKGGEQEVEGRCPGPWQAWERERERRGTRGHAVSAGSTYFRSA